jgi:hypothetical protein
VEQNRMIRATMHVCSWPLERLDRMTSHHTTLEIVLLRWRSVYHVF